MNVYLAIYLRTNNTAFQTLLIHSWMKDETTSKSFRVGVLFCLQAELDVLHFDCQDQGLVVMHEHYHVDQVERSKWTNKEEKQQLCIPIAALWCSFF